MFVKNKPFKGEVSGKGSAVMVEAEAMLKALGVNDFELKSGELLVNGKSVPVQGSMVSLKALTEALDAKMIVNADFGTVDVYEGRGKMAAQPEPAAEKPKKPGYVKPHQGWLTSWNKAAAESKRTGKPIMINFTGSDWCGWCMKLKKEVFSTEEFKKWASQKVVLLEIDFPKHKEVPEQQKAHNESVAQKFRVSGFPSVFFSDSEGNQIGPRYGYQEGGPAAWTQKADEILSGR